MTELMKKAIAKIDAEGEKGGSYGQEIAQFIIDALITDDDAARKILADEKSLAGCIKYQLEQAKKSAEKEKSELTGRLEKVEKDAKLTASPEVAKFSVYFDSIQKYINVMRGIIASMDDKTTAAKLRDAMRKLGALLQEG